MENSASIGGGVAFSGAKQVIIDSCRFYYNNGHGNGAGAAFELCTTAVIKNSDFANNCGNDGGGVSVENHVYATLENCSITNNSAEFGGAIACLGGIVVVNNCILSEDTALTWGGAIHVMDGIVNVKHTHISSNLAYKNAGAVNLWDAEAVFDSCTITDNHTLPENIKSNVFFIKRSKLTIHNSTMNNKGLNISIDTGNGAPTENVDAVNNWWGNNSGPFHPVLNPEGTGGSIPDHVDFIPWLEITDIIQTTKSSKPSTQLFKASQGHLHGTITFCFNTAGPGVVRLFIYNMQGKLIGTIDKHTPCRGRHSLLWDRKTGSQKGVSGNVFFCRLETKGQMYRKVFVFVD